MMRHGFQGAEYFIGVLWFLTMSGFASMVFYCWFKYCRNKCVSNAQRAVPHMLLPVADGCVFLIINAYVIRCWGPKETRNRRASVPFQMLTDRETKGMNDVRISTVSDRVVIPRIEVTDWETRNKDLCTCAIDAPDEVYVDLV